MNKLIVCISFLLFIGIQLNAQEEMPVKKENKNGLRFNYLFNNHQFGIDQTSAFDYGTYTHAAEISYVRKFHRNFNIIVPLSLGGNTYPNGNGGLNRNLDSYIGLDVIGQFLIANRNYPLSPYIFGGIGGEYLPYENENNFGGNIPLGAGLDFNFSPGLAFGARAGYRLGLNSDDFLQIGVGLTLMLGDSKKKEDDSSSAEISDLDGDGISDQEDECPAVAGIYAFNGCPDTDGDGVPDKDDKCPTIFGEIELDGCAKKDSDGDGVPDENDDCPNESGTLLADGCPDSDGDGVADKKDKCPNNKGAITTNGCPDADDDGFADNDDECPDVAGKLRGCPDSDSDGVSDDKDKCPNEAGVVANGGCPQSAAPNQIKVKEIFDRAKGLVEFETASARLKSSSLPILNEIIALLNEYPTQNMKIGGHTDSIGDTASNQKLSEKRAKACYDYLIKNGIIGSRLSYKGFGEKKPIATNKYKDGRKKNRRVEFELWKP